MMRLRDIAPSRDKGAITDDLLFLGIVPVKFKPLYVSDEDGIRLMNFYRDNTPAQIKEMKRRATCLKHFGALNNSCAPEWRIKTAEAHVKRFGSHEAYVAHMVAARAATCVKKYGQDVNSTYSKKKASYTTNMQKYGSMYHPRPRENNVAGQLRHWVEWRDKHPDLICMKDLSEYLSRDRNTLYKTLVMHGFPTQYVEGIRCINASILDEVASVLTRGTYTQSSRSEKELAAFVRTIYTGEIIENTKKVIPPKELDIWLPEKHIAIEYNGLAWHSDRPRDGKLLIPTGEGKSLAKWRHIEKTLLCEGQGIRLIHIFEDDWLHRRPIVESLIANALGKSRALPARKCSIAPLSSTEYSAFLVKNHLLGSSPADIRLGLFYKGTLVQAIGIKSGGNHSRAPELVRMAPVLGTRIQGGFSKLLAYVDSNYPEIRQLVSYIDRSVFTGEGYFSCGFSVVGENAPAYFYVRHQERYPRYLFMRKKIAAMHAAGKLSYWNPDETEEMNMYKNHYFRIWNCGTIKVAREMKGRTYVRQGADKVQS